MKNWYYKGQKLVSNRELAKELGIKAESVKHRCKKEEVMLLRLGLTWKKMLDKAIIDNETS